MHVAILPRSLNWGQAKTTQVAFQQRLWPGAAALPSAVQERCILWFVLGQPRRCWKCPGTWNAFLTCHTGPSSILWLSAKRGIATALIFVAAVLQLDLDSSYPGAPERSTGFLASFLLLVCHLFVAVLLQLSLNLTWHRFVGVFWQKFVNLAADPPLCQERSFCLM